MRRDGEDGRVSGPLEGLNRRREVGNQEPGPAIVESGHKKVVSCQD